MSERKIEIKGACMHNLKNVDVEFPRNQFVVVSGVSCSGKSSLVMDTLYGEGHRRCVVGMLLYARQFLNREKKSDGDYGKGISRAIALEHRVGSRNARSTVESMTEVYDFLRVVYAGIATTFPPVAGEVVNR